MSTGARILTVGARFRQAAPAQRQEADEPLAVALRLAAFAALALYGILRWATLMIPAPTWRLIGLAALAVAVAGGLAPLARRSRPAAAVVAFFALLVSLPISGLRWEWFTHLRVEVSADAIGTGLQALAGVLVPYLGPSHDVRLAMTLGAAVLLLDGAVVVAFAPPDSWRGDGRRLGAALPLVALAVVPCTLVRPQLPYLQGLILFGLLALFMWGDRMQRETAVSALMIATAAGVAGAIAAPRLDLHRALVDYRAWAGTVPRPRTDTFDWSQTYGPLHWPRTGHVVLTVHARRREYWKAEDLDLFNGTAWVPGSEFLGSPSPPSHRSQVRWTETIAVDIDHMTTPEVIGAGYSYEPTGLKSVAEPGSSPGTWAAFPALGPGASYRMSTYYPVPSTAQLGAISAYDSGYQTAVLGGYRTLELPLANGASTGVTFPPFGSSQSLELPNGTRSLAGSPYARAYALAQQLANRSTTPYDFVNAVMRYLSRANGFRYTQNPPLSSYPLETFLFASKRGYCQQFSGAMALLLRMGGLPARVAAGFTPGSPDGRDTWKVSDIDAHAWVEVWFPRYGWVGFDPTPASAPELRGQSVEPVIKRLPGDFSGLPGTPASQVHTSASSVSVGHHGSARAGGGGSALPVVGGGAAVVLLLGLGLGLGWRRGDLADEDQLVSELEQALRRCGRPVAAGMTLAGLEKRFGSAPDAAGYVRTLRLARYGGLDARPNRAQRRALRTQLRLGLGPTGRLRALWALPPAPPPWLHGRRQPGRGLDS